MGEITAVVLWDVQPDADAMLEARLRDGWVPIASELQSGPQILGHAAKVASLERGDSGRRSVLFAGSGLLH